MDVNKRLAAIRSGIKSSAEQLLAAVEDCDTPEEMYHLNAVLQAHRQSIQANAYLLGLAMKERGSIEGG